MILSTNLAIFRTGTFFSKLKRFQSMGLKAVELSFTAQEPYRLWCRSLTKPQIEEIREALQPFQVVTLHAGFQELSLLSSHPGIRKLTMQEYFSNLEIAKKIGAKTVTLHPGDKGENMTKKKLDTLMDESLKTIDNKAKSLGILACWEVGTGDFIPLEKFDRIKELSLKNSGICLDTGHLMRCYKVFDPYSKIKSFCQFIGHYEDLIWAAHIHDWQDEPKGKHTWNDHHAVRDGEINWKEVFSSLVKIGYDGILVMEYHPDAFEGEKGFLKSCEYIKKLVTEVGGEIV